MAMAAMDEELYLVDDCWARQLQRGDGITLIPWEDEPFVVTHVFLVDPESAAGKGVVAACVEMGTHWATLAELSSEVTVVELETPVVLHEKFRLYVEERSDADAADTDGEDALVVQFEGFIYVPDTDTDTDEESEEEDDEADDDEDASSEEDDEGASSEDDGEDASSEDDYVVVQKSDAEVDGDVATNPGGNAN